MHLSYFFHLKNDKNSKLVKIKSIDVNVFSNWKVKITKKVILVKIWLKNY